jgi:hypothetical protein
MKNLESIKSEIKRDLHAILKKINKEPVGNLKKESLQNLFQEFENKLIEFLSANQLTLSQAELNKDVKSSEMRYFILIIVIVRVKLL